MHLEVIKENTGAIDASVHRKEGKLIVIRSGKTMDFD
jgi:hypothetical protein